MNEGFIAVWLITMLVILYTTGWQKFVADRIGGRTILLVLAAAAAVHSVHVPLGPVAIRGSAAVVIAAAAVSAIEIRRIRYSFLLLLCALSVGIIWLWIDFMYVSDPVLILFHPEWDGPLAAGMIGGLLTEQFRSQFSLIALSAAIAPFVALTIPSSGAEAVIGGSPGWWDGLMIGLVTARLTGSAKGLIRYTANWVREGRYGQRGGHS